MGTIHFFRSRFTFSNPQYRVERAMKHARCAFLLSVTGCCLLLLAPPARGQDNKEEAKKHFEQGAVLYQEGNYQAALVEFKASYEKKENWKVRYYIGVTLQALHKFVDAEKELKTYLEEGKGDVPKDKKEEVETILSQLDNVIGSVHVKTNVDGAVVFCNGEQAGATPLAKPLRLNVGTHKLVVTKEGYEDYATQFDLPGGETLKLDVVMAKKEKTDAATGAAAAEKAPPAAGEAKRKEKGKGKTGPLMLSGWALLGAGAAMLVAGAGTGGAALSLGSDLEKKCPDDRCEPPYHDDYRRMQALATASDVMLGLGGACAVAAVALLVVGAKKERKGPVTASVVPLLPAGVALKAEF